MSCGDNAQPAAVSCLSRAFKRIHDVHCWLLCRPSGEINAVWFNHLRFTAHLQPGLIIFFPSLGWEWEYGYPFIQGRLWNANTPPPILKKNDGRRRRWCSASGFGLVTAQTRNVCAVLPPLFFISYFIAWKDLCRFRTIEKSCIGQQKCRRWGWGRGGESGATFSALAVN